MKMQATRVRITDACRERHGDEAAFEEAVRRLREEYFACAKGWPVGRGVVFELVLELERPNLERRDQIELDG